MAVAIKVTRVDNTNAFLLIVGTLTLTGNYGTAGSHGDVLNFSQIDVIKTKQLPAFFEINEQPAAGAVASGFQFNLNPGTTLANGVMQIMTAANTEFVPGAAYSSSTPSINNVVLGFMGLFPSFI